MSELKAKLNRIEALRWDSKNLREIEEFIGREVYYIGKNGGLIFDQENGEYNFSTSIHLELNSYITCESNVRKDLKKPYPIDIFTIMTKERIEENFDKLGE